jgi:NAD(P)-dependent dehydrogenase (short-subunit alcohol dehydrogenase family)
VTGAARGIGAAIARRLARDGFALWLVDHDAGAVRDTAAAIAADGGAATPVVHDLTDVRGSAEVVESVLAQVGRVDVLVNNAGIATPVRSAEVTESDWDRILDVNAKGLFFFTQPLTRHMAAMGSGSVVSISSISGKGWRGASSVPYAASKAAIIAMSRILAAELGPSGVRVNTVCPGITRTPMSEAWSRARAAELGVAEADFVRAQVADAALGRASDPEDVAAVVSFLASPGSRNISGQSFNVDGGTVWD